MNKPKVIITNDPIDLWELGDSNPEFQDDIEIWERDLYLYETIGREYSGSLTGYVEIKQNPDYSYERASGNYNLTIYSPKGEILHEENFADDIAKWCGCRKLPFVGYVYRDKNEFLPSNEVTIWIIFPKSKEQVLKSAATFYKRRRKTEEIPNIIGLKEYINKQNSIGTVFVQGEGQFIPLRKRLIKGKKRPTATQKRIKEYRDTAPELTDDIIEKAIKEKYDELFTDNTAVGIESIKECFRNELPLTLENIMQQLAYLLEDRQLLKYLICLQYVYSEDAQRIREKADIAVEQIYDTACKRSCKLSDFADAEAIDYFKNTAYKNKGKTLAEVLDSLTMNYHCRVKNIVSCKDENDFPPFDIKPNGENDLWFYPRDMKTGKYPRTLQTESYHKQTTPTNQKNNGCMLWLLIIPVGVLFYMLF